MPQYTILANRVVSYEFVIEADTEDEAIKEVRSESMFDNCDDFAYAWSDFEIVEIEAE
jgi:hypothetical protein